MIDEPSLIDTVRDTVGTSPVVIADGHHRYETAIAYRQEQSVAGTAGPAGPEPRRLSWR